jgi:hypothetical protein
MMEQAGKLMQRLFLFILCSTPGLENLDGATRSKAAALELFDPIVCFLL